MIPTVGHMHAPDPSRACPGCLRSTSPRPAASAAPSCCTSRWPGHVSSGCYTRVPEKNLMNKGRHVSPASCRSGRLPLLVWTGLTGFTSLFFWRTREERENCGERRRRQTVRGRRVQGICSNTARLLNHAFLQKKGVGGIHFFSVFWLVFVAFVCFKEWQHLRKC